MSETLHCLSVMLLIPLHFSINIFLLYILYYTYTSVIMSVEIQHEGFVIHALIIRTPLFQVCVSPLINKYSKGMSLEKGSRSHCSLTSLSPIFFLSNDSFKLIKILAGLCLFPMETCSPNVAGRRLYQPHIPC